MPPSQRQKKSEEATSDKKKKKGRKSQTSERLETPTPTLKATPRPLVRRTPQIDEEEEEDFEMPRYSKTQKGKAKQASGIESSADENDDVPIYDDSAIDDVEIIVDNEKAKKVTKPRERPTPERPRAPQAGGSSTKKAKAGSDEEDEADFIFKVRGINREITVGAAPPGKSMKLQTKFDEEPYVYHGDHMAPFRGIIADWRDEPNAAALEISDLFRENRACKLMAATTGREFTPESRRAIIFAAEKLTERDAVLEVNQIRKSAWAIVVMKESAQVKVLTKQKIAFDQMKKMLVTFRKPKGSQQERVFEVRNVKASSELDDLRCILKKEQKVKILSEVPPRGEWTTIFDGRVVWKVLAPDDDWEAPSKVLATDSNVLFLTNSPTCDTCHSDDHHFHSCPWKTILPDVSFRRNAARK